MATLDSLLPGTARPPLLQEVRDRSPKLLLLLLLLLRVWGGDWVCGATHWGTKVGRCLLLSGWVITLLGQESWQVAPCLQTTQFFFLSLMGDPYWMLTE